MQASGVKQRQKSAHKPQNGEPQRRRSEDEPGIRGAAPGFSPDAKLCVSLLCLSVSLFIAWLHLQQSAKLAEITHKYELLRADSRGVLELEHRLTAVSQQLQACSSSVSSTLHTSAALQAEQEASSLRLHSLQERLRSGAVREELEALKTRSRAAHSRVTQQVNAAEAVLRELSERLQEVRDGTGRNARALERSEEEDAGRVRDQLQWSERGVSRVQEQLRRLEEQGLELRRRLDSSAPRAQSWQRAHLPDAEEAVRSMLRVRAQLSDTYRRLEQLQLRVRSAEERRRITPLLSSTDAAGRYK
ncbi:inhibitor of nuclear factor kappa-B kinase-interacting protein isoform X2 [Onychostoma macrolepis]|uniref:inhibitor of nuclear factor kappa-B kinase-interacting protein isoform X2 n=1 Tax=Onychostoma macrolepis TaxID=369639 RepID=UPI00272DBFD3|nr:inhibitor of nuclear factor kappa-B kinase-interacting protein isoform X2 [Onychostoma macrolepis]